MRRPASSVLKLARSTINSARDIRLGALLVLVVIALVLPPSNPRASSAAGIVELRLRPGPALASARLPSPAAAQPAPPEEAAYIWPVEGSIVQGMWAGHPTGIDIGAYIGQEVRAVRSGTVAFAGGNPCCEYGYYILIAHDAGMSSVYGHLSSMAVRPGQQVKQGEVIGQVGMTGKTTGPHLHFELRSAGRPVDPLQYLSPRRAAPPPPDLVALDPIAAKQNLAVAVSTTSPMPTQTAPDTFGPNEAAQLAVAWMREQPSPLYDIDSASCAAAARGPNYAVTCVGDLLGCTGLVCQATLTVCVYFEPRLVSRSCP